MKLKSLLFSVLLGSAGLFSTQALAGGSVGGDCCADLEERVAELEATTARKGNRPVTLTVYGRVIYALWLNDENNAANDVTIGQTSIFSTFGLKGKARISSDVFAGYRLEFGIGDADFGSFNRNNGGLNQDGAVQIRHNDLYIGSKTFGQLSLGFGSTASNFTSQVDLSGTIYYSGGALNEYNVTSDLDGLSRRERIRYDSPTLAGFRFSASWQDNEDYDLALRYGANFGQFTVAGAVAYTERGSDSQFNGVLPDTLVQAGDETISGSASVLHRPTGLSLTAAAGDSDSSVLGVEEYWYVKAGLQRKFFSLGKTALALDYHDFNDGTADKIGFHFVQSIDAAAMKLFISVWDAESDEVGQGAVALPEETAGFIGAIISF